MALPAPYYQDDSATIYCAIAVKRLRQECLFKPEAKAAAAPVQVQESFLEQQGEKL